MSPDLPVSIRELVDSETGLPLGSRLSDGYVVVSKGLADAARLGEQQMTRQQRRAEARAAAHRKDQ